MTNRKFHRTLIQVEVLSEEPYNQESLEQVNHDIIEGDCSGKWEITKTEELDGQQAAQALIGQASDPSFFRLTEEGNDTE